MTLANYQLAMLGPNPPLWAIQLAEASIFPTRCGSRVTCNPVPEGADEDWLILANPEPPPAGFAMTRYGIVNAILTENGFGLDVKGDYQDDGFESWKLGDQNVIIALDAEWFHRHCRATEVCKRLNLLRKADRVMLFRAILYEEFPKAEAPELIDFTAIRGPHP